MRLFTLALPLTAALVLVVPANADARKPPPKPPRTQTPTKFGTPVFVSTVSPDGIHRDITLTVPFTHQKSVAVELTVTANGVVHDLGVVATYRGTGSATFSWSILGTDGCFPPLPGDKVSYHLQLVEMQGAWGVGTVPLDEITTPTYVIT